MDYNTTCEICGNYFYLKPSHKKKLKNPTCSMKCSKEMRKIVAVRDIEERLGIESFKDWLKQKYIDEVLTTRQIAKIVYGKSTNSSSINFYMNKYEITMRRGSEAIKTQWINADERKEKSRQIALKYLQSKESRDKVRKTKQTVECSQKQSISKTGIKNGMYSMTGEKNPNWNPNLTEEERSKKRTGHNESWRTEVFTRDGFTCQSCGDSKGGNLVAHHMDSYHWSKEYRYNTNNGMTLCDTCHKSFHKQHGYKYNTKKQMKEFLETKYQQLSIL